MDEEIDALVSRDTWELVSAPKDTVVTHWVYTLKYHPDGTLDQYKARFVAKVYTQTYGVDYFDIFISCSVEFHQDSIFYCCQSVVALVPIEYQKCLLVW